MDIKKKSLELMRQETYCVISTVNQNGKPESSFVAFSDNDKFELMIGTSKNSRKYKNIETNPHVSVAIGFDGEHTVQYEGIANIIKDEELKQRLPAHLKRQPGAEKYQSDPNNIYLNIKPTWLQLTKSDPNILGEMRQF